MHCNCGTNNKYQVDIQGPLETRGETGAREESALLFGN